MKEVGNKWGKKRRLGKKENREWTLETNPGSEAGRVECQEGG